MTVEVGAPRTLGLSGAHLHRGDVPGEHVAELPPTSRAVQGHYPGYPIVPGIFLVDLAAAAESDHLGADEVPAAEGRTWWTGVRSARFRAPVFPGDHVGLRRSTARGRPRYTITRADGSTAAVIDLDTTPHPMAIEPARQPGVPPSAEGTPLPSSIIPHRPPMLLLDEVLEVDVGRCVTATSDLTGLPGVEPHGARPVPWPLLIEALGQAAAVLATWDDPSPDVRTGTVLLFGGARDIVFGARPSTGDRLVHHVQLVADAGGAAVLTGSSWRDGREVLRAGQLTIGRRPPGSLPSPTTAPAGMGHQ